MMLLTNWLALHRRGYQRHLLIRLVHDIEGLQEICIVATLSWLDLYDLMRILFWAVQNVF